MHVWENEWVEKNDEVKAFIKNAIEGKLDVDSHAIKRDDGLFEIDRSKFNRCAIPSSYVVVSET